MRLDLLAAKLAEDLADLGQTVVAGESLFIDAMSAETERGVLLRIPLTGIAFDHYIPNYYPRAKIQVIVRAPTEDVGKPLADAVVKALTTHMPRDYEDEDDDVVMRINQMLPDTLPIRYPRSEGNLIEWSINFYVNFVLME